MFKPIFPRLFAVAALAGLPAWAGAVTIDFETAGFGSLVGRAPASQYVPAPGVTFGGGAFAAVDADNPLGFPGSGNFARAPTPIGALTFFGSADPTAPDAVAPAIINYASGFNVEISFSFSTISVGAWAEVWSGLDGTGTLLARTLPADVPALGSDTPPFPGPGYDDYGAYNIWASTTLEFEGVGQSIVLGGSPVLPPVEGYVVGDVFFDDVSFSLTPSIPEPSTYLLMFAGLAAIGVVVLARRR